MWSTYIVDVHVLVIACIFVLDIRRDNELMASRDRNLNGTIIYHIEWHEG